MNQFLKVVFGLYAISLLTSMAGMELFGWLSGILSLVLFVKLKFEKNKSMLCPPLKVMASLWVFFLIVVFTTVFLVEGDFDKLDMVGSLRWIILLPLLTLGFQVISIKSQEKFFKYLVYIGGMVGLYAIVQHFFGQDLFRSEEASLVHSSKDMENIRIWRSKGFFSQPLTYAYSLGMFVCFPLVHVLSNSYKNQKLQNYLVLASVLFIAASIVTTYSRGGWLAFSGATLFLVYIKLDRKQFFKFSVGSLVTASVVILISPTIRTRFLTMFNLNYGSNSERFNLWAANWEMFKDNPLFGVGWNLNKAFVTPYLEGLGHINHFTSHAHNTYVQLLAGTGIFGFIALLIFFATMIVIPMRMIKSPKLSPWVKVSLLGAIAAQINLHIGGLSECNFTDGEVTHQVVFIWAWVLSIYSQNKEIG